MNLWKMIVLLFSFFRFYMYRISSFCYFFSARNNVCWCMQLFANKQIVHKNCNCLLYRRISFVRRMKNFIFWNKKKIKKNIENWNEFDWSKNNWIDYYQHDSNGRIGNFQFCLYDVVTRFYQFLADQIYWFHSVCTKWLLTVPPNWWYRK